MPTLGNTPRPAYVYDTETDTWVPVGVGAHTHAYIPNTLVDAKGDIVTASANDVPAILSKGADGTILVSDSTTSTGLAWQPYAAQFAAGKNKIINSDFANWQRGTSFVGINGGVYTADRWVHGQDGTGSVTYSQQTFTPGTAPVTGYEGTYFLRTTVTATGTASFVQPEQRIEDVRTLAGQTATMSFWAKADSARSNILAVVQVFGSGGSSAVVVATPTINYTTSWQRFTFTFAVPSVAGKTIGTGSNLSIGIRSPLSSGSVVDIWGVQLEAGSVATAFQTATGTIQGELAACQRYYQNLISGNAVGSFYSSSSAYLKNWLPVEMRTTPTVTFPASPYTNSIDQVGVAQRTPTSYSGSGGYPQSVDIYAAGMTGATLGYPAKYIGPTIQISAEL